MSWSRNAQSNGLNPIVPDIATRNLHLSKRRTKGLHPVAAEQQCLVIAVRGRSRPIDAPPEVSANHWRLMGIGIFYRVGVAFSGNSIHARSVAAIASR